MFNDCCSLSVVPAICDEVSVTAHDAGADSELVQVSMAVKVPRLVTKFGGAGAVVCDEPKTRREIFK